MPVGNRRNVADVCVCVASSPLSSHGTAGSFGLPVRQPCLSQHHHPGRLCPAGLWVRGQPALHDAIKMFYQPFMMGGFYWLFEYRSKYSYTLPKPTNTQLQIASQHQFHMSTYDECNWTVATIDLAHWPHAGVCFGSVPLNVQCVRFLLI